MSQASFFKHSLATCVMLALVVRSYATDPNVSGSLLGVLLIYLGTVYVDLKYGKLKLSDIILPKTVKKWSLTHLIAFFLSTILFIYSLSTTSFLLCLVGSLLFVSLAITAPIVLMSK